MIVTTYLLMFVSYLAVEINGHGRFLKPPSRSSMFRYKNMNPLLIPYRDEIQENYNDVALNCGGRQNQVRNNGVCGVCGDPYDAAVKQNEAGGKYALGIIAGKYTKGELIEVEVEITAPHKGYFEFRLCPWNNVKVPITHECLDEHLLSFESGDTKWYLPEKRSEARKVHSLKVRLPANVICEQCVLQWRWRTGNSWGAEGGKSGLGLGQQEEFYGCSDIEITDDDDSSDPETTSMSPKVSSTIAKSSGTSKPCTTTKTFPQPRPTITNGSPTNELTPMVNNEEAQDSEGKFEGMVNGIPISRDCTSFYVRIFSTMDPFIFSCPDGTVFDERNGRCDDPYDVPPPCGTSYES